MPYFPILSAPGCFGRTTLFNFPPNNREIFSRKENIVNLTWQDQNLWKTVAIDKIKYGETKVYDESSLISYANSSKLLLLSLSNTVLPVTNLSLPPSPLGCVVPTWRATLELVSTSTSVSTSYQGEIDPFPSNGSLLSFSPFFQTTVLGKNYLLFLNLENSPCIRPAKIKIFRSTDLEKPVLESTVFSNSITRFPLDHLGFQPDDLVIIASTDISGIPLFFSASEDHLFMSLEHTHPPASYVIHGNRWAAQKLLKNRWFTKLNLS